MNSRQNNLIYLCLGIAMLACMGWPILLFKVLFPYEYSQYHYNFLQIYKIWLVLTKVDLSLYENSVKYRIILFIVSLPIGLIFPFLLYGIFSKIEENKMRRNRSKPEFASLKEIREYTGKSGFILTKNIQLKEQFCFEHVLVIGPTGSGKTQSFFFPNLYLLPKNASLVVTDPKGELYRKSKKYFNKIGRKSILVKFDNHNVSNYWNPLEIYNSPVDIKRLCELVVKNRGGGANSSGGDQEFWDQSAINVLYTVLYVLKAIPSLNIIKKHNLFKDLNKTIRFPNLFSNFYNAFILTNSMPFEAIIGLSMFASALSGDDGIYKNSRSFSEEIAPEDTRNSMRSVLLSSLASFTIEGLRHMTAYNEIDFKELKHKSVAIFVSLPEHKTEGLEGLLAVFYRQIFDILLDEGMKFNKKESENRPVYFLLDEFANIGKLIGIAKALATIRSRKLAVAMCLQSIEQLSRSYSEPEKKEMLNNLKTKLILPGLTEAESLRYFSDISGKTTIYDKQQVGGEKQVIEKERLPQQAIRELESGPRGTFLKKLSSTQEKLYYTLLKKSPLFLKQFLEKHEAIVFFANKPPIKDYQRRAYLDKKIVNIWQKYPETDFPQNPKNKELKAEQRFFDTSDLSFLTHIGLFLYCKGNSAYAPQGNAAQAAEDSFKYILHTYGQIPYTVEKGNLILNFTKNKAKDKLQEGRNKLGRFMLQKGLNWAYRNKLMNISKKGSFPILKDI